MQVYTKAFVHGIVCSVVSPTFCDPMDCSLLGSAVHGIFQAESWSELSFLPPGVFPIQGLNPHLLHWQAVPYH